MGACGRGGVMVMIVIGRRGNSGKGSTSSGGCDNKDDSGSGVHTKAIVITVPRCLAPPRAEL
jgi:hypothetical protein